MTTYYLCNKRTKEVLSIGPLPETWGNASGISSCSYEDVYDLSWTGESGVDMGFLTERDAINLGVSTDIINAQKLKSYDLKWEEVKRDRDSRIEMVRWRIERHNDQVNLRISPTENIMNLLKYVQDLRDITQQEDPFNIVWPALTN